VSRDGDHGAVGGDLTEDGDWEFSSWGPNDWDPTPEDAITPRRVPRAWRIVGIVAVLSVLVLPMLSLINARPQFAHNGLEVCRFDYCEVERQALDAGLGGTMAAMSSIVVPESDVQSVVDELIVVIGGPPVTAIVVDDLPGDIAGQYNPSERLIEIDHPANLWVIAHEVAHAVAPGHDDDFMATLFELGSYLERTTG
jgi:hypothetical protein